MKTRHPRKRATARSRASKRQPLAALKNPKPHIPASMAPRVRVDADWVDEGEWAESPEIPGFWTRMWRRLF